MISYSLIGSKVWRSVGNADSALAPINHEDIEFLDFQVLNWHRSIPDSMRFIHPESGRHPGPNLPRALPPPPPLPHLRPNQKRHLLSASSTAPSSTPPPP